MSPNLKREKGCGVIKRRKMKTKCQYCGAEWDGAGYKGACPKCPPGAMEAYHNRCKKCNKGQMKKGIALMQTIVAGMPDFIGDEPGGPGCTMSPGGPGEIVEVMKCDKCGYSVTDGQPIGNTEQLPKCLIPPCTWCMCEEVDLVARDMFATCGNCGGRDAYGTSEDRPEKYKKKPIDPYAETEQLLSNTEQLDRAEAAKKEIIRRGDELLVIKSLVRQLFEILEHQEENQNGKLFHPTYISSCRVQHNIKLGKILTRLEEMCVFDPLTPEQMAEIDRRIADLDKWKEEGTLDQHCVSAEEVMRKIKEKYNG
jgi:hypothetical protein